MYTITSKKNFGVLEEVEKLELKEYEVVALKEVLTHVTAIRDDLVQFDTNTNIAKTNKPEELQKFINSYSNLKNYKPVFVY